MEFGGQLLGIYGLFVPQPNGGTGVLPEDVISLLESHNFSVVKSWNRVYVSTPDGRFVAEVVLEGRRLRVASLKKHERARELLELLKRQVDEGARDEVVVVKDRAEVDFSLEELGFVDMGDKYSYFKERGVEIVFPA